MIQHVLRRLLHDRRLNGARLLCLTLASALMAGLSGHATAISARELQGSLEAAGPAGRSLYISGPLEAFDGEMYAALEEKLGRLLEERLEIRRCRVAADPPLSGRAPTGQPAAASLDLYSFDSLAQHVRLVEGRLPEQASLSRAVGNWPPPVEAVIGRQAAEQSGYGVGDRLTASRLYHRLDIVGIVEPIDGTDDVWGQDLGAFAAGGDTSAPGTDTLALPLIIAPESMRVYVDRPVFPHEIAWRITLHTDRICPDRAEPLRVGLIGLQAQVATRGARTETGLVQIMTDQAAQRSRLRVVLLLLGAQDLIVAVYALGLLGTRLSGRLEAEVTTLSTHGAGTWQIVRAMALENLAVALPAALILGPGLGQAGLYLWSRATDPNLPAVLTLETWLLSGAAAGAGWLIGVVSVYVAALRCCREPLPRHTLLPERPTWHRHNVDLYLLAFGGLLVWQLNRSGSLLARLMAGSRPANGSPADPLLMLGPLVVMAGAAMVYLRIVPLVLGLAGRLFQARRGAAPSLGLLRAGHDPRLAGGLALLVGMTAGLGQFARVLGDSMARSQVGAPPDPLAQAIGGIFRLNALMLALFGAAAFFLVYLEGLWEAGLRPGRPSKPALLSAHKHDLGILQALGLPVRQAATLIVVEGGLALILGLLAGLAVGLGLSYTMAPYLFPVLHAPDSGAAMKRIVVDWAATGRHYALLTAAYGSVLTLLGRIFQSTRSRP